MRAVVAAISLVLCIGSIVLWVRSHYVRDAVGCEYAEGMAVHRTFAHLHPGGISVIDKVIIYPGVQPTGIFYKDLTNTPFMTGLHRRFSLGGFGYFTHDESTWLHSEIVCVPLWFMTSLTALPPAVWLMRRLRCRYPNGYCRRCGYDLRGTPARCPECGTRADFAHDMIPATAHVARQG